MPKSIITQPELKEIFFYEEDTGNFIRRISRGKERKGVVAGKIDHTQRKPYVRIHINYVHYYAHRLAWLYVTGFWPKYEIDHIDGNVTNNKWNNLRDVTHQENNKNQKLSSRNKSGHYGVRKCKNKWVAFIDENGKTIILGRFHSKIDAIICRKIKEQELGFHSNHGR